jgi:hypothetical protein
MRDYESRDLEAAARLAREDELPPEPERPTPGELAQDEAEWRLWLDLWRKRQEAGRGAS